MLTRRLICLLIMGSIAQYCQGLNDNAKPANDSFEPVASHSSKKGSEENIEILASIQPLYLISQDLTANTGLSISRLLSLQASPHHYALTFSDRRRIQSAALLIWLGETFEPWLTDNETGQQSLPLLDTLFTKPLTTSSAIDSHAELDPHAWIDPHIWLDPEYGLKIAELISLRLQILYPQHKSQLQENLHNLQQLIIQSQSRLEVQLHPFRQHAFFVDHDAYSHFVQRFQLRSPQVIYPQEGQQVSLKHLSVLNEEAQKAEQYCVFVEVGESQRLPSFAYQTGAYIAELDIIGAAAQNYPQLLEQLGEAMTACLQQLKI